MIHNGQVLKVVNIFWMIDRCTKCNVYLDISEFIFNECKEKKTKRNIRHILLTPR